MIHRVFLLAAVLMMPTSVCADPSLAERIQAANFWERYARYEDNRYFMVGQPSLSELARARELGVPATSLDATAIALGRPIVFNATDGTGGANVMGAGILDRRVEDSALKFKVGANEAYLVWGNYDGKHAEFGNKPFGVAYQWQRNHQWYSTSFGTGEPFGIYLRVRQSKPESTWRIVTGPNPEMNELLRRTAAAPGGYTAEFKVIGTEWQTIPVIFGDKIKAPDGKPASFLPFGGFAIYPGDPGNEIELAWIRVTDPGNHVYARRTVNLPAAAIEARMTLSSWDAEVYVDGHQVAEPWFPLSAMGVREINLASHLSTPGRHVIAVHAFNYYAELSTTGGIRCSDGTFVPLSSWQPLKLEAGRWVSNQEVDHFSLQSPWAGPWKTAFLAFRRGDSSKFMLPEYDDGDWGSLTGMTTSGISPVGPPYFGLIAIDLPAPERKVWEGNDGTAPRKQPIFSVREAVQLSITALRTGRDESPYELTFTLVDKQTGKSLEQGELSLDKDGTHHFRRAGLPSGPYELQLALTQRDAKIDERAFEFLVVGPINQPVVREDDVLAGLTLKTVVDIDCASPPTPGAYGAFLGWAGKGSPYEARVVESPFGRFRETGPDNADCFSYKAQIPHPGRPHILEVTYPDDKLRVHGFFYTEPSRMGNLTVGVNRCSIGVLSGWPDTPTSGFKKTYGLFWPVDSVGTVDVYTTRYSPQFPAANAAAARIRIHEIEGELPRFDVHDYPGQFKPIGVHTERGGYVMWPTYYNGRNNAGEALRATLHDRPDFYADWYSVTSNFTRALRFHGLNFYFAGQHMYGGTNFPSVFNDNDNGSGGALVQSQRDWAGILAAVLGENDCGFATSFEYINNSKIVGQGVPSQSQLARAKPTLLTVSEAGKPYPYTAGITELTPLPSWVHPDVQAMFLTEIDEVIELYKEYPAWKGISLLVHTICGPSYGIVGDDPLKIGYEDVAARRFEHDTGIHIPVAADDPNRFAKRYAWVTGDPKNRDAWVQWRCDVLLQLNRQVRDRIHRVRPDCNLYLDISYPYRETNREKILMARDPETLRKYIMQWGWDVTAYQREPGMIVSTMITGNLERSSITSGKPEEAPRMRESALEPNYLQFFSGGGKGGAHLYNIFTENWPLAQDGKWLWSGNGAWVGYHWATGPAFNDYWTNMLARIHPSLVIYNWHDSNLDSRIEPGLRRFTRAWRPLPNGRYDLVTGDGIDANLVVRRCADKPAYYYLANPCSWAATITLTFSAGAKVTDLNHDQPVTLGADGTWKVESAPYALRSFRVEDGALSKTAVVVDAGAIDRLTRRMAAEEVIAGASGALEFATHVTELKRALAKGNYRLVEETLRGDDEYQTARNRVVNKPK